MGLLDTLKYTKNGIIYLFISSKKSNNVFIISIFYRFVEQFNKNKHMYIHTHTVLK